MQSVTLLIHVFTAYDLDKSGKETSLLYVLNAYLTMLTLQVTCKASQWAQVHLLITLHDVKGRIPSSQTCQFYCMDYCLGPGLSNDVKIAYNYDRWDILFKDVPGGMSHLLP